MKQLKGRSVLTWLDYEADEIRELLKSCGFRFIKHLTKDGFVDVAL